MTQLNSLAKSLVPHRVRSAVRAVHRDLVFRRAMKRFLKNPEACKHAGNPVIGNLIYGWGNEGWSALEEYLAECMNHAWVSRGPILECGSGLSTILIGAIAKERGQRHWALEHTPHWATRVQGYLNRYKLDSVVLCTTPLKDYGEFCWYEAPLESMPESFSLVICDGPPGGTKGGRYGLLPLMKERHQACVILLHDSAHEEGHTIARRCEAELGGTIETLGSNKPFIKMTVDRPHQREFSGR